MEQSAHFSYYTRTILHKIADLFSQRPLKRLENIIHPQPVLSLKEAF